MASVLLTDSKIKGIKPKEQAYYVWQASATRGTGRLGVKIYPSGRKVFVYKYHKDGARKFLTLGDYPFLSLAQAAAKCVEVANVVDEPQRYTQQHATLKNLFDDYIADQIKRDKRSYKKTEDRLRQVLASSHIDGDMPAKEITPDHIKRVLAEFISRGAAAGANKVRANLHAVFNFGLFADNDPANINVKTVYGMDRNPVSVIPSQRGADKALDRFLSWDELRLLLEHVNKHPYAVEMNPDFAQLTKLCIWTGGQRPWELMTNTRDNWDRRAKTLTVPPHISKNADYHVIPLSESATQVLEEMLSRYPDSTFLFPAETKEGHLLSAEYSKQLRKFCTRTGFEKFTPRDIRRTFKTLAGDMGISAEMRDRLQNHKKPGVSTKHYDRYDYLREKRQIIEQWEAKLIDLTSVG
ncbi:tyrosine-type recombinase/integrase [Pantoea ananatis]|uniref:tyrosine-type recombinase/integrase n=1 Tax=Pantoea ananas TaxID=553 RepID=UPI0023501C91|nr:site-specific integrase [Pantoea ananatis]MDC7861226.1 recombinase [Pantoea ananatis]